MRKKARDARSRLSTHNGRYSASFNRYYIVGGVDGAVAATAAAAAAATVAAAAVATAVAVNNTVQRVLTLHICKQHFRQLIKPSHL